MDSLEKKLGQRDECEEILSATVFPLKRTGIKAQRDELDYDIKQAVRA